MLDIDKLMQTNESVEGNKENLPKKKREDNRNNGIRISKQLAEKLGDKKKDIQILVDFERQQKAGLELSSCSDEMRRAISEKMLKLTELLEKIYKITKSHQSNDYKKEKLEALLKDMDITIFTGELSNEIMTTREQLMKKGKELAEKVTDEVGKKTTEIEDGEIGEAPAQETAENQTEEAMYDPTKGPPTFRIKPLREAGYKEIDLFGENEYEDFYGESGTDGNHKEIEKQNIFKRIKNFISEKSKKITKCFVEKDEVDDSDYYYSEDEFDKEEICDENERKILVQQIKQKLLNIGKDIMTQIKDTIENADTEKSMEEYTPRYLSNFINKLATFNGERHINETYRRCSKEVRDCDKNIEQAKVSTEIGSR